MGAIGKIHDRLFRALVQRPESAQALLRERLPREYAAKLSPEPPESPEGTTSDSDLRAMRIDRLFRVRMLGDELPLYCIVEHRSTPDPTLLRRLLEYQNRVWRWTATERVGTADLQPPIVTLVVYHGKDRWNVPRSFRQTIAYPKGIRGALNFGYSLVDLGRIKDAELSGEPVLQAGFMALKYATRPARQAGALVATLEAIKATRDQRVPLLLYVAESWKAVEPRTFERVREQVGLEGPMTTIADELRREGERLGEKRGERRGERRGRREGKVDLLTEQLHERFGAVPESRCSQLASAAEADLDRWAVRLVKARDLDSVFE